MCKFLKVAAMLAVVLLASCSSDNEDEPKIERKITVEVYQSAASLNSGFYKPESWSYANTMLFACNESDIDKAASTATLASDKLTLNNGSTVAASYKSDTGVIYDAANGNYTLVVYCTGNPFNAYLEHRWTCKQLNYSTSNAVTSLTCCFVWEDMATTGGWSAWQNK